MINVGTKLLETERLILRRFRECDALELYNGFINQDEYLYYFNKSKRTLEEEKKSLIGIDDKYNDDYYNWVIVLKSNNAIIGRANLMVEEYNECVEVNYAIDNRYIQNGYMTEALKRIIKFCFEEMKINRFESCCVIENIASRRVMEKCNMKEEGIRRKYVKLNDGYHDMYMYSIIKND